MLSAAARAWPEDPVGVLGLMLLEDVVLGPGEAAVIPAGCPHAYICGKSRAGLSVYQSTYRYKLISCCPVEGMWGSGVNDVSVPGA
jgi:hypothetical protein